MGQLAADADLVQLCFDEAGLILEVDTNTSESPAFKERFKFYVKNAIQSIMKYCNIDSITDDKYIN